MSRSKLFTYEKTIFFHDTDQAGVVHHANYLKYMEEARIDCLKELGIYYHELQKNAIGFAPVDIQIQYKHPLRLGDTTTIKTQLSKVKKATLIMSQDCYLNDIVCTTATVKLACLNEADYKVVPIPPNIENSFSDFF